MKGLNGRYYAKQVISAEFSPVTDFREAKCRQYYFYTQNMIQNNKNNCDLKNSYKNHDLLK